MRIDELNTPVTKYEYSDFASYYEPMQITEEQKEKRTETAHDLFFDFLMLFALISQSIEAGDLDYMFILQQFQDMYSETVNKYARTDDYTREYVDSFTRETMDTTWSHLDLSDENSYWLSDDRASILALNESNTINNYEELAKKVDEGKNAKIWRTMNDRSVRHTHSLLEGKKLPIDRFFKVGDAYLLFPRDELNAGDIIKEIAGCRCSLEYGYDEKYPTASIRKKISPKEKDKIASSIRRYSEYKDNWAVASLSEARNKFAKNAKPEYNDNDVRSKIYYKGPEYSVVYDFYSNYFRIEKNELAVKKVRRRYSDLDGEILHNKLVDGRQIGIPTKEYEKLTHYYNGDKV